MDFKQAIAKSLGKSLSGKMQEKEIFALIETPKEQANGDFAFPCFKLSSVLKQNPVQIAGELSKKISLPKEFEKAEAKGPYLNFFLKKQNLAVLTIKRIFRGKSDFGKQKLEKKKIMVEYSGPNTNKPLHLGHLRNDSIGMAVSNLLEAAGNKAIKANIYNDRGIHICKSMLAYQKFGNNLSPEKVRIKPDHFVGNYYVLFSKEAAKNPVLEQEAQELLKKWEAKDPKTRALWKKMNAWILKGFKQTYKRFGSKFDKEFFESNFYNKAKPLIDLGIKKGIFKANDDCALVAGLEPELPDKIVLRPDGTSIYLTNDLALTKHKFEKFKLDKSIWVVGNEQNLYFQQLFLIFEKLGFAWAKNCRHLSYGMVFLPEGKMKSREGKVVDADDLMDKMSALAEKEIKKREPKISSPALKDRREKISLAAIKFFLLKTDFVKDINFDPEKSLSFEGETGPYLQYTYARAKSILRKSKGDLKKINAFLLKEPQESALISALSDFPETIKRSAQNLKPHILCHYLISLAETFNSFYHSSPVLKAENKELAKARLGLVAATAQVLKNGLELLNIPVLEKM